MSVTDHPFASEFDTVRPNFKAYDRCINIEPYSEKRLISDYALAAAWAENSPEAQQALSRIVDEYYSRHRIDLSVVAGHLGRPARYQTEVDDIWREVERGRNHASHHRRRRLSTYIAGY